MPSIRIAANFVGTEDSFVFPEQLVRNWTRNWRWKVNQSFVTNVREKHGISSSICAECQHGQELRESETQPQKSKETQWYACNPMLPKVN